MALAQALPEVCDDTALLTRIRRGDENAMATFFDRYATIVYSVALRVLHHAAAAEEIAEEIFLDVWRTPESLLTTGTPGAYLALIARNRAIDALLRRPSSPAVNDISLAAIYDLSNEEERSILADRTSTAVFRLPRDQRKALEMACFDGLSHTEIAEITGDTASLVRMKIRNALLDLRKAAFA
ncbi:MAG TPA: sigma-70 family RNA polymerase sigma factor [Edaphobacter sp.]|jgi:RNA polymerase sigma-70 factor (ECF subfamily)|nr:sigma-70 family RNA polymerase sigma factor [Edaphobacter sp.]